MKREALARMLEEGLSLEAIGESVGRHPSTVAYWLRKHGLDAPHAGRYTARGPLPRELLEDLVGRRFTIRAMSAELDRSSATVRYWLKRHGLRVARARGVPPGLPAELDEVAGDCPQHGMTTYTRRNDGAWRCLACRSQAVSRRRRRVKEILVAEAGGCCLVCGYHACVAALEFHHVDPAAKSFDVSRQGVSMSLDRARAEARKCVLLCSNCHAEVESGFTALPAKLLAARVDDDA